MYLQLLFVFHHIIAELLELGAQSIIWKTKYIIPVLSRKTIHEMNFAPEQQQSPDAHFYSKRSYIKHLLNAMRYACKYIMTTHQ